MSEKFFFSAHSFAQILSLSASSSFFGWLNFLNAFFLICVDGVKNESREQKGPPKKRTRENPIQKIKCENKNSNNNNKTKRIFKWFWNKNNAQIYILCARVGKWVCTHSQWCKKSNVVRHPSVCGWMCFHFILSFVFLRHYKLSLNCILFRFDVLFSLKIHLFSLGFHWDWRTPSSHTSQRHRNIFRSSSFCLTLWARR